MLLISLQPIRMVKCVLFALNTFRQVFGAAENLPKADEKCVSIIQTVNLHVTSMHLSTRTGASPIPIFRRHCFLLKNAIKNVESSSLE